MYTERAFVVVLLVDASGVVAAAIRLLHNRRRCGARRIGLGRPGRFFRPWAGSVVRRARERERRMAKLIQICASQNDLFGLDADGVVYHYNFNTNSWIKLDRRQQDAASAAESQPMAPHEEGLKGRGRLEASQHLSRQGA